ncbi:MAG TPA: flagellar basal body P-ring protein FlgI [Gammaproteobacteria bacterium]|nr:flagellar basal body P-ring protein FlgI [Gammaproteobacteria bacterium]
MFSLLLLTSAHAQQGTVRLKDLGRFDGVRDNALTGYGLVVGLAGTGDSGRSEATLQSVANALRAFGVMVSAEQLNSRNVAAVFLTANLPAFAEPGHKLDINVSSVGDARSLLGGTLLLAPLRGPDQRIYALAQGPVSVGGFKYDLFGNVAQKNHPTVGVVPEGATVERALGADVVRDDGSLSFVLYGPDFTTADRIADAINQSLGSSRARAVHAGRVRISMTEAERTELVRVIRRIEALPITPDYKAVVVVNERTGTVVAGGDVTISAVSISHGDLKVAISTDFVVSQPFVFGENNFGPSTVVVPDTAIEVEDGKSGAVALPAGATVTDLVSALNKIDTSARDVITILQAIRRAGALHAELVVQ